MLKRLKRRILSTMILLMMFIMSGCADKSAPLSLRVGIPHSDNIQNLEKNYYLEWLQKQTGFEIVPVEIGQTRCEEYLTSLATAESKVDIVLFGNSFVPSEQFLDNYASLGYIHQLSNGNYAYMNYGTERTEGCGQVMWINSEWLNALSLEIPKTTEELKAVLHAFKNLDPNGNGVRDEIALIGSMENYSLNPLYFIMNAFVYCDPYHTMHLLENGNEVFAPETEEFVKGIEYCRELFSEELIDERSFNCSPAQLSEIVNSPDNLVGAFTSHSIGDVIYQGNPEIMARYICIPPICGQTGECNALYVVNQPVPGAVVINGTGKEAACEELLDTMMTLEGSLIARFGEEGVDWEYSDGLDVSLYGEEAKITTINYIWNSPQNKHLNGIGPMLVPDDYFLGVTWNGVNSDMEYIDARTMMSYWEYFPKKISAFEYDENIIRLIEQIWTKMIKGEYTPNEDILSWDYMYNSCYSTSVPDGLQ